MVPRSFRTAFPCLIVGRSRGGNGLVLVKKQGYYKLSTAWRSMMTESAQQPWETAEAPFEGW